MKQSALSLETEGLKNILLSHEYTLYDLGREKDHARRHDSGGKGTGRLLVAHMTHNGVISIKTSRPHRDTLIGFKSQAAGGQSPHVYNALLILAEAISRDNTQPPRRKPPLINEKGARISALRVLSSPLLQASVDIEVRHSQIDDISEQVRPLGLSIILTKDSTAWVITQHADDTRNPLVFNPPAYGGRSACTYRALQLLLYAIQLDNAKNP